MIGRMINTLLIKAIRLYQISISPIIPSSCRFYPTCSHYSMDAFKRYGIFKGFWLTLKRLFRCHPFHEGGYDPLP